MRFYTLWLSLICIVVFVIQLVIPSSTDTLVLNQASWFEPWRFISSIFLHGSFSHILYNLFALVLFGLVLEKLIGSNKFLLVFFSAGIFANLIAVNFYSSSLGASGAIMGVIGALTFTKPLMTVWAFSLPMPMFVAAILWILGDVVGVFAPSGVGNIAHLIGVFVGLLLGAIFRLRRTSSGYSAGYTRVIKIPDIPESYVREWEDRYFN